MTCSLTDFDQPCDVVTVCPDRRTGPMLLRLAVRSIVLHRPLADRVEIELRDGTRLEEVAIEALYQIASGAILSGAWPIHAAAAATVQRPSTRA